MQISTHARLQALRHMYVLATEKRLLIPIDETTRRPCYARVALEYPPLLLNNTTKATKTGGNLVRLMAPCMLPEFDLLNQVTAAVCQGVILF